MLHNVPILCIGHTGEQLSERFSKHRCDINNTSYDIELAKHFHECHNVNDDLNVTFLQNKLQPHKGVMRTNGFVS